MNKYEERFSNCNTPDELYQVLVGFVDEHIVHENGERSARQAVYDEFQKPYEAKYMEETEQERAEAETKLAPHKAKYTLELEKVRKAAEKKIDKLTREFTREQTRIRQWYEEATRAQQEAYDKELAEQKQLLEADFKKYAEATDEAIKPINAAYHTRAKELGLEIQ
jgi:hypothetical protein